MLRFLSAVLLLAFVFDATLRAQIKKPEPIRAQIINPKAEIVSGSEKIVKGAPFSAEAVSESVQILFDGNRISQSVKSRLYRDGEGRFRRDELPKPVGIGSFVDVPQVIFILDPVASVKFYLYPESKTFRELGFKNQQNDQQKQIEKLNWDITKAEQEINKTEQEISKAEQEYEKARQEFEKQKSDMDEPERKRISLEIGRIKQQIESRKERLEALKERIKKRKWAVESQTRDTKKPPVQGEKRIDNEAQSDSKNESRSSSSSSSSSSVTENDKPAKVAAVSKTAEKALLSKPSKISVKPTSPNNRALPVFAKGEFKNESLGTRNIEGVEAEGVRQTTTVPAGAIGNERPIDIVYERWYSKELELIVFSRYSDPRFGEQTYRLTNIRRSEPDGALFTPPADYRIVTEPEKRTTIPRKKAART